jgi:NAD(P)-dependent dehydrogenase (short-subunit alcohol dehydrogenase family)
MLVLGGTAWLGAGIARRALEDGWEVTCLARGESGSAPEGTPTARTRLPTSR